MAILEYLKDAVHNTARLFKKSFLERLKFLVELGEEEMSVLQQAEYLLSQNTERLKGIRKSFEKIVSGEAEYNSSSYFDAESGFDIRRKLLTVLDVVLQTPDNLEDIKKAISSEDSDKLEKIFTKTKTIRKDIVAAGQDVKKPDFGRK